MAPHLKADVAQSNAVSPAPSTITLPYICGSCDLHAHIPETQKQSMVNAEQSIDLLLKSRHDLDIKITGQTIVKTKS